MTLKRDALAPAGISGDLLTVVRGAKERSGKPKLKDRTPRGFRVQCEFSRETQFGREVRASVDPRAGSSFFLVPADAVRFTIQTAIGDVAFAVNARREVSGAAWEGRAKTPQEARTIFLKGIGPTLDHFAYLANAPLIVGNVVVEDPTNRVVLVNYTTPYADVTLDAGQGEIHGPMIPILALYREAKNSASAFYRFLCYYKILEGVFLHLRPALFVDAKRRGLQLVTAKELIPPHDELKKFGKEIVGRSVKDFFDNTLQREYRNVIAHYLQDNGEPFNPSDVEMLAKFQNIMLATELACRVAIDQQERYYTQLDQQAPVAP